MHLPQLNEAILNHLHEGVYLLDHDRAILSWNHAAELITGFPAADVLGRCCRDNILVHIDDHGHCLCHDRCPVAATLQDGQVRDAKVFLHHKDGHRVPVDVRIAPLRDETGQITAVLQAFSDTSALLAVRREASRLQSLALLDPLTGLANRRYLDMRLESRLEEWVRYGWPVGVFLCDLDNFKHINDTYGHDIGDHALRMVGRTVAGNLRASDLLGRWGGDEFLGIVAPTRNSDLAALSQRLNAFVANSFLQLPGNPPTSLHVTISIGAAVATVGETALGLIRRADRALYDSKSTGRNRATLTFA